MTPRCEICAVYVRPDVAAAALELDYVGPGDVGLRCVDRDACRARCDLRAALARIAPRRAAA